MRALSYILMVLGIFLLVNAGYEEFHGSTTKPVALMGRRYNTAYLYRIRVLRDNNPELFREFMSTHWIYASVIEGAGCFLYLKTKKPNGL